MTLAPSLLHVPEPSEWEIWAPHTWAPWLSVRFFRMGLFFFGAFLLDRAWRTLLRRLLTAALRRDPGSERDLEQRLDTIEVVVRRMGSLSIYLAASLMTLADFGVQVGPLLAGLGIVGVAVGFGAQYMIRDLINGFFLLAEDQFRVGDSVKVGDFSGSVETMTLRSTRLRALGGEVITIPNGEIRSVTNYSRHWSRAVLDVGVARGSDLHAVFEALQEACRRARADAEVSEAYLEDPQVVGVTDFTDSATRVRVTAKVAPGRQWDVERALRRAVSDVLTERDVPLPSLRQEVALDETSRDALLGAGS